MKKDSRCSIARNRATGPLIAALFGSILLSTLMCKAHAAIEIPTDVGGRELAVEAIRFNGKLVAAYRISDRDGEHILILSRKDGPSPSTPRSRRIERIELFGSYYKRVAPQKWQQDWTIRDHADCPGFDAAAGFFAESVSFSDLNKDGKAEVTVPYRLFCGGGVDPYIIKVILRDGPTKLAIRGESLVRYPGQEPFGGEHQHDKALLAPDRAAYKQHLDAIWKKVSVDMRK
jgi:hypothetical protein